jgi:hypothetical protein
LKSPASRVVTPRWLRPLAELLLGTVLSSPKIFADDTPVPVLDLGRGRTKTGRLRSYARDDRPWQGPLPPAVAYVYSDNRQGVHPRSHLADFTGLLQVDGYTGFNRVGSVELAFCWVHARRKFFEFHYATASPVAAEAHRRALSDRGAHPRLPARRARPHPAGREPAADRRDEDLAPRRARAHLGQIHPRRGDPLRAAPLAGAQPLPSTTAGSKSTRIPSSAPSGRSDGGAESWATIASLIQTARLNDVEPFAYLRDVLERIVSGKTKASELGSLLPWAWKTSQAQAAVKI